MSSARMRLLLQALRHFAVDDALREALDDRGLADARLADQHGVVLRAPLQHLDGAADLLVAADDRIELALLGALGEIDGVLLQRLAAVLGVRVARLSRRRALPRSPSRRRRARRPRLCSTFSSAPVLERREHEELAGDVLVAALLRELVGDVEQAVRGRSRRGRRRRVPSTFGRRSSAAISSERSLVDVRAGLVEQRRTLPPCWLSSASITCAGSMNW